MAEDVNIHKLDFSLLDKREKFLFDLFKNSDNLLKICYNISRIIDRLQNNLNIILITKVTILIVAFRFFRKD